LHIKWQRPEDVKDILLIRLSHISDLQNLPLHPKIGRKTDDQQDLALSDAEEVILRQISLCKYSCHPIDSSLLL